MSRRGFVSAFLAAVLPATSTFGQEEHVASLGGSTADANSSEREEALRGRKRFRLPGLRFDLGARAGTALLALQDEPSAADAAVESAPADGGDPARRSSAGDKDWRFAITPFLWAAEFDGRVGIGPLSSEGTISFSDILDNLDLGAMAHTEISWRRFGLMLEGIYLELEDDLNVGALEIETTLEQVIFQFAPRIRLGTWDLDGETAGESLSIWEPDLRLVSDVYAGGRYVYIEGELDPEGFPSRDRSKDWIDPLVGARIGLGITRWLSVSARGDIGGFGAASELTWGATGLVNVRLHEHFVLSAGYSVLDWDYSDGSGNREFDFDAQIRGPILGLRIVF